MIVGNLRGILQQKNPQDPDKLYNQFEQMFLKMPEINHTDVNLLLRKAIQYSTPNFQKYYNLLINHNVNVNYSDNKDHKTNLMIACEKGTPEIVEILLTNQNIKVDEEDNLKNTALIYAIDCQSKQDRLKKTKIILQKHPQLIPYKSNNKNILIMSIQKNSEELVKLLLQKGEPPNSIFDGFTPLFAAVKLLNSRDRKEFKEMVKLLLKYGANPEHKDKRGKTVLDLANERVRLFIQNERENFSQQRQIQDSLQRQQKIRENETCYFRLNSPNQLQDLVYQANQYFKKNKQKLSTKKKLEEALQFWSDKKNFESDEEFEQGYLSPQYINSAQFINSLSEQIKQHDIDCFHQYRNSSRQFQEFFEHFKQCMKQRNIDVEIYGSFGTGLWLKHCDIDLLLIPTTISKTPEDYLLEAKAQLQKNKQICKNILLNKKVKVPMLRFELKEKNKDKMRKIDITVFNSQHNGQKSINMIKNFMDDCPNLRPLFYIIKSLTNHYRLNDPKNRGIRSYAVIVMLYNFLYPRIHLDIKLGQLLLDFLNFFGFVYDYTYAYQSNQICLNIIDPLNYNNNIGNNSTALGLQNMFRASYIALHTNVRQKRLGFLWETKKLFNQQLKK